MEGVLVDTNVLLDLVTEDSTWAEWSQRQLDAWTSVGPLLINAVIYAELSIRYREIEQLEAFLADVRVSVASIPRPALFLAGKAFQAYRREGGARTGVLPDFFIGAHAAVDLLPLLSRDTARYRTYFPELHLISPEPRQD